MMKHQPKLSINQLNHFSGKILNACFKVHSKLGPGLLEKTYEVCLMYELGKLGLQAESQVEMLVQYDDIWIDLGYRADLLVENCILVELKSVERINALHEAQLLTYLRLSHKELGLLINFNVVRLTEGIRRFITKGQLNGDLL